jgi:hypothetical protein
MFELTTIMMKRSKFLIVLALLGVSASCSDPAPAATNPQDEQLTKLSQTWKVSTSTAASPVTFNSTPITGYENFTITMSGTAGNPTFNFTTLNRPSGIKTPWDASGTYTFGTDFNTIITRGDGIQTTYSVSTTQLELTFTYTGAGFTGRTSNVEGTWKFKFGI